MPNETFKNTQDIKKYLEICSAQYDMIDKYIKNSSISFFSAERKKLKKQLKEINSNIKIAVKKLESCTIFERNSFLQFLKEYLTLIEGEKYVLLDNVQEDDFLMAYATNTYPLNLFSNYYNIITTTSNAEKLKMAKKHGMTGGDTDDIKDFLSVCENRKYICLEKTDNYSLLDGTTLNKDFSAYPYLLNLAYELIDLKLERSELSDKERLNFILSKLQENKKTKSTKL